MIRQPIVSVLGHVDHGKTSLLDAIRGTVVAAGESGGITQHIGASVVPLDVIKKLAGSLLENFKIKVSIPGLLFIDTPGHEAFTTLRKRGGSVADLAILVVDITEGFQQQTDESIILLKQFKVPFVVAATKIDKIPGWFPHQKKSFMESLEKQRDDVKEDLENKLYKLVAQISDRGFDSERLDRITDFAKQIAIVPCSGKTSEGVAEVLLMLAGLSQQFLKDKLEISKVARGSVLEVKHLRGLGTTIDVILYDGKMKRGDHLIIGGNKIIVTKVKALLVPRPLQELRVEKQFNDIGEISAAAGIKISAIGLDEVMAGSPLVAVKSESEIERAKKLVTKEIEQVQFTKSENGVAIKADTLGGLEAMIKILEGEQIPIRNAEVGNATRQDVLEAQNVQDELQRAVIVFNQKIPEDVSALAKDLRIQIFSGNVIYRIVEEYKNWISHKVERELQEKLGRVTRPCKLKILKGTVFRVSKPAVFGVEVKGILKTGIRVMREDGKIVGKIKEIQKEGQKIDAAKSGEKVAVSMDEPTVGRQIEEGDVLFAVLSDENKKVLKEEVYDELTEDEKELLKTY